MTQIITRYFESADQAKSVYRELVTIRRFSPRILSLYSAKDGLAYQLAKSQIDPETAKHYEGLVAKTGSVLLVRAGYKPLSVAQTFRDVTAEMGAADLGDLVEEVRVSDKKARGLSVLQDHPHILARPIDSTNVNTHMADWPIPLINRRKPFRGSVIEPHGRMASWPIALLLPGNKRYGRFPFDFLIPGHKFMAKFPFDHLVPGHKFMAKFPFGHIVPGHKFMANFPFGHIVPGHKFMAKFPFGHLVPGHRHMANWPFPHLIDGKTGTNALMPGGPRMANFPISLLSGRKPFDQSIFGRHARMANFPLPLISRRVPFSESAFPRHARMADVILPLILRDSSTASPSAGSGFSLSKFLNFPTILRR
ncbi:PucR family transcriptional regulator [Roseobacter sp.]|uniref:PucR family transcriptional regulator n=1 Tax=Roseobacter sp. TaxID=1907202 RepID=UPI00385F51D8